MELLSGDCIQVVPLNVLMSNCVTDDRTKFLETIEWLKDFIRTSTGLRTIFREVDNLSYTSPTELYIPAYVLRNRSELKAWASEYKKIDPENKVNVLPIIIVNAELYEGPDDRKYIEKSPNAIYIQKRMASTFLCFSQAKYDKRGHNTSLMQRLIMYLSNLRNQSVAIHIPTLENEGEHDPDYVSLRQKLKTFEPGTEEKDRTLTTLKFTTNTKQQSTLIKSRDLKSFLETEESASKVRPFMFNESFNFENFKENSRIENNMSKNSVNLGSGKKTKPNTSMRLRSSYSTVRLSQNMSAV